MKRISMLLICVGLVLTTFAQDRERKITINFTADAGKTVESLTTELLRVEDSTLVKTAITDKSGLAEFVNIRNGHYIIRVSGVEFQTSYSPTFNIDSSSQVLELPSVHLQSKESKSMQGVVVTAKKPFIQKLSDRLVVNVENSSVNAGSTALEVLERSPGITIDQNDAISLRGRAGVIIMIDGKPSSMSGADLANYLKSLPSNAIDRIEIITNPSAKYDAAGNSGIIDIRMKKDQRLGTNGTLNAGYGQWFYPKANAGINFNHRNKVMNVFGSYNYSNRKGINHLFLNRNFYNDGVFQGSDDKENDAKLTFKAHTARLGVDFFTSPNTIIGMVVNSNLNMFDRRTQNNTTINNEFGQAESRFLTAATNDDKFGNTVVNANFKHNFNDKGKSISVDLDYGVFNSTSLTSTTSRYYELNGTPKNEKETLDGDQDRSLKLKTAKADYTQPLGKDGKFEAGLKTSYVSADNDAKFYNVLTTGTVVDESKTNRFFYEEYNYAGYLNYSREYKKFNWQLGLRGEKTNFNTRQVKLNKQNSNDYFSLFPSAFLNYKMKEDQTIGVSVSRRIDRPNYHQLNPFLFQIDATVYATGEPNLQPQMTWSYELNYNMKSFNFTFGYSKTTDPQNVVIARILDVIPDFEIKPGQDSNITVQIPVNLQSSEYYGLTATVPVKINSWWNMINNLNIFYNHFNGNLGGVGLNDGEPSANIRTNNNFSFKKGWSAELNANYITGGRYGYMVSEPQWGVSVGGQKTILKNKGTLKLNITDIFWTSLPKATINYPGKYVENWHADRESRVVNLSFTYRFGNNKVQAARKRSTGSEEERQRAGGN